MSITIREADLVRDREELVLFLHENLSDTIDASRFDWLYLDNPCGPARAWLAHDDNGKLIGTSAAFPHYFWTGKHVKRVWAFGDFCIAKEHRSLGPALSLQRVSLESLASMEAAIWYDFPGRSMLPVYRRMAIDPLGQHVRYVKLLRVDPAIQKFVRESVFSKFLIWAGNHVLVHSRSVPQSHPDITFSAHETAFGEEFDSIDPRGAGLHTVRGFRNSHYLNWRFLKHPSRLYWVATAREGSRLVGYVVMEIGTDNAELAELRTTDPGNTIPGLLAYAETVLREMQLVRINAHMLGGCYLIPYLRSAGFYARESTPVMAHAGDYAAAMQEILDPNKWFLLHGDRDS